MHMVDTMEHCTSGALVLRQGIKAFLNLHTGANSPDFSTVTENPNTSKEPLKRLRNKNSEVMGILLLNCIHTRVEM